MPLFTNGQTILIWGNLKTKNVIENTEIKLVDLVDPPPPALVIERLTIPTKCLVANKGTYQIKYFHSTNYNI